MELLGEAGGVVCFPDDDPLVADAAERLSLDEGAGQQVAGQPRDALPRRLPAAGLQLHQLARPHSRDRGQRDNHGGPDDLDQADGLFPVQGTRPANGVTVTGERHEGRSSPERPFRPDDLQGRLDGAAQDREPGGVKLADSGLAGEDAERDRREGVIGRPACLDPVLDVMRPHDGQGPSGTLVLAQHAPDVADRGHRRHLEPAGLGGPSPVRVPDLLRESRGVGTEDAHQVQGGGERGPEDLVGDGLGLVDASAVAGVAGDGGRGCPGPGPQAGGDPVGGEQLPVVEEVGHDQRGEPSGAGASLADLDAVVVPRVAAVLVVGVAVRGGQVLKPVHSAAREPRHEADDLVEPSVARAHMMGGAVGPRERGHRLMMRGEKGHDQLFRDQAPAGVGYPREVEAPALQPQGDRQADHLAQVPQVVIEEGPQCPLGQGKAGLAADIGSGEGQPGGLRSGQRV